ncbi:MAG: hypothetical protein PX483_06825 [Nostocales cyanobacterium LE14-WE4]|jgi:hypothetical protein|nr:hypothetical protein [Nostocales cyanobacterium LE14-WE4]
MALLHYLDMNYNLERGLNLTEIAFHTNKKIRHLQKLNMRFLEPL